MGRSYPRRVLGPKVFDRPDFLGTMTSARLAELTARLGREQASTLIVLPRAC